MRPQVRPGPSIVAELIPGGSLSCGSPDESQVQVQWAVQLTRVPVLTLPFPRCRDLCTCRQGTSHLQLGTGMTGLTQPIGAPSLSFPLLKMGMRVTSWARVGLPWDNKALCTGTGLEQLLNKKGS